MANFFRSVLLRLQGKTVTAGTSASTVTVDTGYDGLSSVTVNPTPSETKTQAPSTTAIDVTPSSGKLLSKVTVSAIPTETKSQAAGTSNIDVTPTSGKYLTKVTITPQQHSGYYPASGSNITTNGTKDLGASHNYRYVNVSVPNPTLSGDAGTGDVLSGKTFYNSSYTKQTGTISSKAAATYNTSSSDQTISSGQYLSGTQTIKAVTTSGISAANIKDGAVVKVGDANSATRIANVTGTFTDASTVSSGQTAAAAAQIKSGYSAWVDGAEVKGTYTEPTLSGDAAVGNVLSGKTFYNTSTTKQTGTMTNNGAIAGTVSAGSTSYTVPAGYHNGSGSVSVTKGVAKIGTTDKTWANNGTVNLTAGQSLSIGAGAYYAGTINAPSNPTLSGDAGTGNVLSGKTFYSNSYTKQTGAMANNGDGSATLNCGGSKTLAAGYYSGGTISANSLASQTGVDSGKTAIDASHVHSGYQGWVNGSKVSGTYTEPTIQSITPSNVDPVSITSGNNYTPTRDGKVVEVIKTLTPSNSNPQALFRSTIYKTIASSETLAGYAYETEQKLRSTTLWTNSSPTSTMGDTTLSLSQSMDNFDYLKFTYRKSTTDTTSCSVIMSVSEFKTMNFAYSNNYLGLGVYPESGIAWVRPMSYASLTSVATKTPRRLSGSNNQAKYAIPTSIAGLTFGG